MSMDYSRYPTDWKAISLRIRERDNWQCKECGLPNGALILRSDIDAAYYLLYDSENDVHIHPDGWRMRLSEIPEEYQHFKYTRVVLTVHHKGATKDDGSPGDTHDKMDCRDCNLESLCQRCHFLKDLPSHIINAAISRRKNKEKRLAQQGYVRLFND